MRTIKNQMLVVIVFLMSLGVAKAQTSGGGEANPGLHTNQWA